MRPLRRRDFLVGTVAAVSLAAVGRGAVRWVWGPALPEGADGLRHLGARQAGVAWAAAEAMLGPAGGAAMAAGTFVPHVELDGLLDRLAPDQRRLAGVGLILLDEWTWSSGGFSNLDLDARRAQLARWAVSDLGLQRSIWGLLHAAFCASFGGHAGWALMDYPGPCVAGPLGPGRPPGQTAPFDYDEAVP